MLDARELVGRSQGREPLESFVFADLLEGLERTCHVASHI
jgi:hypothetical protein